MPVLLQPAQFDHWLSGKMGVEDLKPAANDTLQRWPVSKRVNSSKADKDDATLIERVGHSHSKAESDLFASPCISRRLPTQEGIGLRHRKNKAPPERGFETKRGVRGHMATSQLAARANVPRLASRKAGAGFRGAQSGRSFTIIDLPVSTRNAQVCGRLNIP